MDGDGDDYRDTLERVARRAAQSPMRSAGAGGGNADDDDAWGPPPAYDDDDDDDEEDSEEANAAAFRNATSMCVDRGVCLESEREAFNRRWHTVIARAAFEVYCIDGDLEEFADTLRRSVQ